MSTVAGAAAGQGVGRAQPHEPDIGQQIAQRREEHHEADGDEDVVEAGDEAQFFIVGVGRVRQRGRGGQILLQAHRRGAIDHAIGYCPFEACDHEAFLVCRAVHAMRERIRAMVDQLVALLRDNPAQSSPAPSQWRQGYTDH